MLLDQAIARVAIAAPDLAGRVESAAELAQLIQAGNLPQVTPAAFVLPLGIRGLAADAVTGVFRQKTAETIGIVLVVEAAGDGTGGLALAPIHALVQLLVGSFCGWVPNGEIGPFRLVTGRLVSLAAGTVIYQLDFAIDNQLRIST